MEVSPSQSGKLPNLNAGEYLEEPQGEPRRGLPGCRKEPAFSALGSEFRAPRLPA